MSTHARTHGAPTGCLERGSASEMGRQGSRRRVATGLYRDGSGLAAVVHANGYRRELRFPATTPIRTVRAAADELRAQLRKLPTSERSTLAADAPRYLQRVEATLASFVDRKRHLEAWLPRFGHIRTLLLGQHTTALNDQLQQWRERLSPASCNLRRDALTNCVKVLYGRRAVLELVDVIRFRREPAPARWIPRTHIEAVLARLAPHSKTEARLRLMHWTGMRPSQMGRLTATDFHLDETPIPFVIVPRGKGGRTAAVPLVPEGVAAARAFLAANAWSSWSCPSANKALARAAARAGVEPFTVYVIRHAFASALRHTGADVADIQDLYGHTDPATTRIYARESLAKHFVAIARLSDRENVAPKRGTKSEVFVTH